MKNNIKKYFPAAGLVILTLALMLYFKENRGDFGDLVHKGTNDILAFYTQNLKPLLFETDITNRDVFNFAMYQQLPLDKKKNSVIKINNTSDGNFYEVQTLPDSSYFSGYDNYVKYMDLSPVQKNELDSLLDSYRTRISEAVFVNDKKTIAINSRLAGLQKALLADIVSFSQNVNSVKTHLMLGSQLDNAELAQARYMLDEIKSDTSKQFIVIANDTVFTSQLQYDSQEMALRIDSLKQNLALLNNKSTSLARQVPVAPVQPPIPISKNEKSPIRYKIEKNKTNVYQPFKMDNLDLFTSGRNDSLMNSLDNVQKKFSNFNFDIKFDSLENALKMSLSALDEDSLKKMDINFEFGELGALINKTIQGAIIDHDKTDAEWEQFGKELDSITQEFIKIQGDTAYFNSKEFQEKMEKLEKLEKQSQIKKQEK